MSVLRELRGLVLMLPAALLALTWGCATAPYTGRQQVLMVSQEQELALGYRAFEQLKAHSRPAQDVRLQEQARRVGERLARAADRPDFRWEFVVFQNDRVANAFCLPGGKVGIYTGLFKYIKSDADLATVMAHETAHVLARHAGERVSQRTMSQLGGMLLGVGLAAARVPAPAGQMAQMGYGLGSQVGVLLPYSRLQEKEADRIGLILMAKAGYDPEDAVRFWERFAAAKKDKFALPEFLSSHPSDQERLRELRALVPEAQRYYVAMEPQVPPPAAPPGSPQARKPELAPGPAALPKK